MRKNNTLRSIPFILCQLFVPAILSAQFTISFHHLSTANGLSDNSVSGAAIDKNGYLWIATAEGLNRFDGREVKTYTKENFPLLKSNNVREIICDGQNRLWVRSAGGSISMLDQNRKWHDIKVLENNYPVRITNMIETKSRGMVLFRGSQQYTTGPASSYEFSRWEFPEDSLFNKRNLQYSKITDDRVVWTAEDEFFIMNYETGRVIYRRKFMDITSAVAGELNQLYITTTENGGFYRFNVQTGKLESLKGLRDQFSDRIFSNLQMARRMPDNRIVIASGFAGLYVFDPATTKLYRFEHDPLRSRSVSGNNYNNLITDSTGYVLVTSPTNGISYFNIRSRPATWVGAIRDNNGHLYDGYVNTIVPASNPNELWLGCFDQLIKWDKKQGTGKFFDYGYGPNDIPNRGNDEVTALCRDMYGKIWVGTANHGVVVLDANGRLVSQLNEYNTLMPSNNIRYLMSDSGTIWISTGLGICMADARRPKISLVPKTNALFALDKNEVGATWFDSRHRMWIASPRDGAYRYNPANNTIRNFLKPEDNSVLEVFSFEEDDDGKIYVATRNGLVVFENDSVTATYNAQNGLRTDRCEDVLKDRSGNLWINNHNSIARFNPVNKSFAVYDEKVGLSSVGFRPLSGYEDPAGVLYFGSEKGFSYFHPDSINNPEPTVIVSVSSVEGNQGEVPVIGDGPIRMSYDNNNIIFHISAIDLEQARNIYYRYRLKGFDDQWITESNISNIRYNGLVPKTYTFEVQASLSGGKWIDAKSPVEVEIVPAVWQTDWFRFIASFILAVLFYVALKQREKNANFKAQERARMEEMRSQALQYQLEIEQVINYFANTLSSLQSVDDILWDVVKTCISQLGFQDCVIYIYNENRTMLVQRAAFGPKNLDNREIYNRLEIYPGSGIVGHVAITGVAEIVNDTSKDSRYLPDDAVRLSEIAVPMLNGDEVVGVIDSEHPNANFYNNRHLQILTAIASMVVNKIEQLEAEADSRRKEIEMARLQRDVATLQLTATRAQMNPHFIFNALNSIQQYILRGSTDDANKYLSKFSRLQREILNHCDRPFISLQKEIDMLNMYLQLEQLRFNGTFDFDIILDDWLEPDEVKIPPMILQPFVENAIWHGLMPKEGHRQLDIEFRLDEDVEMLHCVITDNGIGREAAASIKESAVPVVEHVSKGLSLVYSRLQLLEEQFGQSFTSCIEDLEDEVGNSLGTRVEVVMFTGF